MFQRAALAEVGSWGLRAGFLGGEVLFLCKLQNIPFIPETNSKARSGAPQLAGSVGSSCLLWLPLFLGPQENPAPTCLDSCPCPPGLVEVKA